MQAARRLAPGKKGSGVLRGDPLLTRISKMMARTWISEAAPPWRTSCPTRRRMAWSRTFPTRSARSRRRRIVKTMKSRKRRRRMQTMHTLSRRRRQGMRMTKKMLSHWPLQLRMHTANAGKGAGPPQLQKALGSLSGGSKVRQRRGKWRRSGCCPSGRSRMKLCLCYVVSPQCAVSSVRLAAARAHRSRRSFLRRHGRKGSTMSASQSRSPGGSLP
mmetsp:Transcript_25393/g.63901  ORF Transcript_25393/g.63901 Transcript_25393/m.63901 type:complete len:216 (-) Transcript_25393:3656-4303(-)